MGTTEGAKMSILQLLVHADTEYKWLFYLGQWKSSKLIGLPDNFDNPQTQFQALLVEQIKN